MSTKIIKHEIKLQKSVIILLGILSVGVFLNVFIPSFKIKDARAGIETMVGICHVYRSLCVDVVSTSGGEALLVKIAK